MKFTNNFVCRPSIILRFSDLLQVFLSQLDNIMRKYNIKISTSRTKNMVSFGHSQSLLKWIIINEISERIHKLFNVRCLLLL
jgi:hypothetical protein